MKVNFKKIVQLTPWVLLVACIIIMFFMSKCKESEKTALLKGVMEYSTKVQTYIDKTGKLVSYNESLQLENREQIDIITKKDKQLYILQHEFKVVESATSINTVVQLVHDTIFFDNQIPCEFEQFYLTDSNEYWSVKAYIAPKFFMIDSLKLFNEESIVIGTKKKSFWKAPVHTIEVKNSNPYFVTTNIGSYTFRETKKWYEKGIVKFGVGIVAGFVLNNQLRR